jgi:hypothetical protein
MPITADAIRKALKDHGFEVEDGKLDFAALAKSLGDEGGEGTAGNEPDPVQDFMKGLYSSVATIVKAKDGDKEALLQETFQKAFESLGSICEEIGEFGFAAGHDVGLKKAKKQPAGEGADPEDNEDPADEEDMAKFLKSVSPKIGAYVTTLEKSVAKSNERLAVLEGERDTAVFAKRAKEVGEGDAFAATLRKVAKVDPKLADEMLGFAKAKNDAIRKGGLFSEHGGDNGAESGASAADQLAAKATEIMKASSGKVTYAKAFTEACSAHPDIYNQHLREQRGAR